MTQQTEKPIHFHRSDARFCGSNEQARRFTCTDDEVTCEHCLDNVTYVLSPEARAYVNSLNAATHV